MSRSGGQSAAVPYLGRGRDGIHRGSERREPGSREMKEKTHPELTEQFGLLVVLAGEVGGRWSEAQAFLRQLAKAKARSEAVPGQGQRG